MWLFAFDEAVGALYLESAAIGTVGTTGGGGLWSLRDGSEALRDNPRLFVGDAAFRPV